MPFEYRQRHCATAMSRRSVDNPGRYRLVTSPSCNEEIFSIFKDKKKLSAADFKKCWSHYDRDMNGYIEEAELEDFLADLFAAQGHVMCKQELESLRISIMECYDENRDGKIEVLEMTKFLPVESNFLLHFRTKGSGKMTCADFIEIWKHYDKDKSGSLEEKEIGKFLLDMLRLNQNVEICDGELGRMVEEVMKTYDINRDGTIEFNEMKTLLGVEDNVLTLLEVDKNLTIPQFNMIFDYYDVDRSNYLEAEEILQFVIDLMDRVQFHLNEEQIDAAIRLALEVADKNGDGKISREELASFLYTDHTDQSPEARRARRKRSSVRSSPKSVRSGSPRSPSGKHKLRDLVQEYSSKMSSEVVT